MKVLILAPQKLDNFIMSLPYIRGVKDMYPEADLYVHTSDHFQKIKDLAPYIFEITFGDVITSKYDQVFDITKYDEQGPQELHLVDRYLSLLPQNLRRRNFSFTETVDGFDEVKSIKNIEAELVIFPFSNLEKVNWDLEKYFLFISYFYKMNPNKKILMLALETHREILESFLDDRQYPKEMFEVKITTLEGIHSILKRSAFVMTSCSPIKFLATNRDTVVIELNFNDEKFEQKCVYKDNSYLINIKSRVKNKVLYTAEELVFDNNAHFISYLITSVLDEDEEKLRWFAEKYFDLADVFRTDIHVELGLRLLPVYWNQQNITKALLECSVKMQKLGIKNPKIYEDFYFSIFDNSDMSQDQILYDLHAIKKDMEKTRPEAHNVDFFIRQVMNISGQKLLENLPMTGAYYS